MDHLMNPEDSYAERRQLFKNIWETAMNIEDKDNDIMNKPKVIKTLRLDEVDRYGVNKKKKLKLKNLRAVCTKILDFCDRQEADDMFYEQMNAEGHTVAQPHPDLKAKKVKNVRNKKKIKKTKSLYSPTRSPNRPRTTTSDGRDDLNVELNDSRNTSPTKINRSTRSTATDKAKKKGKKKPSHGQLSQPSGALRYYFVIKPVERVQLNPTKTLLQVHKINIT